LLVDAASWHASTGPAWAASDESRFEHPARCSCVSCPSRSIAEPRKARCIVLRKMPFVNLVVTDDRSDIRSRPPLAIRKSISFCLVLTDATIWSPNEYHWPRYGDLTGLCVFLGVLACQDPPCKPQPHTPSTLLVGQAAHPLLLQSASYGPSFAMARDYLARYSFHQWSTCGYRSHVFSAAHVEVMTVLDTAPSSVHVALMCSMLLYLLTVLPTSQ
jgi:hypothetical protein